jgi:hypothetical protein
MNKNEVPKGLKRASTSKPPRNNWQPLLTNAAINENNGKKLLKAGELGW